MTSQIRILSYRYDRILRRSIPDKTEKVDTDQPFTMAEIAAIIKAALIMEPPKPPKPRL
jgi:hypothetical protein